MASIDPIQSRPPDRAPDRFETCDALVVGGGPAGLAAGIALRQQGLDVIVADALTPMIDKACGEGLMPESLRSLARLGIELTAGHEFSGIHFANRNLQREDFVSARFTGNKGVGIRRVALHRILTDRAREIGVRMKWGFRVDLSGWPEVRVGGEGVRFRYLIGADGEASQVRGWAGLNAGSLRSERLGFRRHYRIAPWSDCVEVHWCDLGQAYVTPVGEDEVCVAAITLHRGIGFDAILKDIPYLQARLSGQPVAGRDRGAVTTTRKLRHVVRGNIALVGDASGASDAITGTGLASAFREALLLGDSLGRGSMREYEAGHAGILRQHQAAASMMMAMDRWPRWRDQVIGTLAAHPRLFAGAVGVHTREERLDHSAAVPTIEFGLRSLLAGLYPAAFRQPASNGDVGATARAVEYHLQDSPPQELFEKSV